MIRFLYPLSAISGVRNKLACSRLRDSRARGIEKARQTDTVMGVRLLSLPCLTNTMSPRCRLQVILRVEVAIYKDDGVCRHQVQTLTTYRKKKEKAALRTSFAVK